MEDENFLSRYEKSKIACAAHLSTLVFQMPKKPIHTSKLKRDSVMQNCSTTSGPFKDSWQAMNLSQSFKGSFETIQQNEKPLRI